jgi:hypothetical protein
MITKNPPFVAQTFRQLNQLILNSQPNPIPGNFSEELKILLSKLLNKIHEKEFLLMKF